MSATSLTLKFSKGTLVLEGYNRAGVPELGPGVGWVWDRRIREWRCDAIAYSALRDDPRGQSAGVVDTVPAWSRITWPKPDLRKLRPDQQKAVACWSRTGKGCIVMPTGTGKTEVALNRNRSHPGEQ